MRDLLLRDEEDLAHSQGEISQSNERSFTQHTMTVNNTSTLRKLRRCCAEQQCESLCKGLTDVSKQSCLENRFSLFYQMKV